MARTMLIDLLVLEEMSAKDSKELIGSMGATGPFTGEKLARARRVAQGVAVVVTPFFPPAAWVWYRGSKKK